MALPELLSERVRLRPLVESDAADLHEAYADQECVRYWHHAASASVEETLGRIMQLIASEDHWAISINGGDDVVGHVGFVNGLEAGGHAGFGYLLRRNAWGQGIATEAGRVALGYGFDEVGIARAELWIQRANQRSVRTAEKLGCHRRADGPRLVYGLSAEQWRGDDDPSPAHLGAEPILGVSDVAAAQRWWVEVLGFCAGFTFGEPPTHAGVLAGPGWTGGPRVQLSLRTGAPPTTVFVTVSDLDELAERALAAGATVVTPLGVRPWGVRELELADADGNRVRVAAG